MRSVPAPSTIAFFLPRLEGGGAERTFLKLSGGFADRGEQVDLVVASRSGEWADAVPAGVRLVDLRAQRTRHSVRSLATYLAAARPRVLLSTLDHANMVALLATATSRSGTRTVVRVSNTISAAARVNPSRGRRLMALAIPLLYRFADAVVAPSQGVADDLAALRGWPDTTVRVLPNPVVTPTLQTAAREPVTHPAFTGDGPPVILTAGRLDPQKDLDGLLHAFRQVVAARPARLAILGVGPLRHRLERLTVDLGLGDSVTFLGFDSNPYRYMAAASVFALNSLHEGLPAVLIEALACGTPVVATDCPSGPREILADGRYGRLVPVGDPAALAAAILAELERPTQVDAAAWRPYTLEASLDAYDGLLCELAEMVRP